MTARGNAIGRGGDLLFHIPTDMRHFRQLTTGHTVVMGRRTFASLPKGALPERHNIVLTRDPGFQAPEVEVAHSLTQALEMAQRHGTDIFIIGGADIYRQALPLAEQLDMTIIQTPAPADADAFFPDIDPAAWCQSQEASTVIDPKSGLILSFATFRRKNGC